MTDVEAGGRLIEQQDAGAVPALAATELNQHAREMHALLLAAGQGADDAAAEIREIDFGQRLLDHRIERAAAVVAGAHLHDLGD